MIETFAALDEAICYAYDLEDREREEIDLQCGSLVSSLSEDSPPSVDEVAACFQQDIAGLIEKAGNARFCTIHLQEGLRQFP